MRAGRSIVEPPARVLFERAVFELEVVKRAVYRLTGRVSVEIALEDQNIVCTIRKYADVEDDMPSLVAALQTEVLDQDLRRRIFDETSAVRNVVLAHAFSRANLKDD